jgi:hypothetical protein
MASPSHTHLSMQTDQSLDLYSHYNTTNSKWDLEGDLAEESITAATWILVASASIIIIIPIYLVIISNPNVDLHIFLFDPSHSIHNIMMMLFASMCE